jgi:hypothetical protein
MRTTLTLDPDVAELLAREAARQRKSFKQVVNEAIRRGLEHRPPSPSGRYRVRPHRTTLRPGVDASALNRLADELEDDALLARVGKSST